MVFIITTSNYCVINYNSWNFTLFTYQKTGKREVYHWMEWWVGEIMLPQEYPLSRSGCRREIDRLRQQLHTIQDYTTFKTSSFPRSKAVDSEYALVLDRREVKVWFDGLEKILELTIDTDRMVQK
jgi:hypothetical protein